ncbi:HAMP domain-containing sensor histidine kinase [Nocardiopsis sp. NRRL B-16309]|uniref:sensor histidine kinase n=1 Tax=Nocardiopsis sp. NRRL B-16309 TaxID=1519494 RepID=UPI0006B06385|nr:ATP-binding protein [Nocardiopsis sp. NRRL B-16309]KOX13589.1 histidine kinase [Nocardiopsis sp. NRRL B-16309]
MGVARKGPRPERGRGLTLRTRLALVYTGVFALGGVLLLGANYLVASQSLRVRGVGLATTIDAVATREGETAYWAEPVEPLGSWAEAEGVAGVAEPAQILVGGYQDGVLSDMLVNSVLALVAITLLAAAAGWLIAGRPLRRLHRVTETARTLSEHDLHSRLGLTGPDDEFRELGDTFDAMLSRLERAFESQRRFVANASHELRTPLAVQRAALEVPLAQHRVPDDLRPAFRRALDSVGRSESLISGLLLLARSDRGLARTEEVDLAGIVRDTVARHEADAREAGVDLRVDTEAAVVAGDAVLLENLVRNLVENAVRHNTSGGWVEARLRTAHGRTVVKVTNTGAAIADPDALFEPFHRGDEARLRGARPGSGLGLSIVRSIAVAHGATAVARARPDGGLVVTVGFPAP